jgi:hypothetical protein
MILKNEIPNEKYQNISLSFRKQIENCKGEFLKLDGEEEDEEEEEEENLVQTSVGTSP